MGRLNVGSTGGRVERGDWEDKSEERRSAPRMRRFRAPPDLIFDYKDVESLKPFLSESGKIVPARISRLSASQQRKLTQEVKRARQLALLPISDRHSGGSGGSRF